MADLYKICPRCRGRGTIEGDKGTAACLSCAPRHVVAVNLSEEGIEELRKQNNDQREALYRAAQGCKALEQQYGIPAARTCRRCGLGPCQLGESTPTPLRT